MKAVVRHLRQVALQHAGNRVADGELLEAFLARREEAAFEALLRRHGPMVLGVCRRVLRHEQDAEDAFQATFLVLATKAASVRPRDLVAPWLYGVARRTALKARAMSAKRREKERRAAQRPPANAPTEETSEDLVARLDAALARLPDRYRIPLILCELEGRSRKEAAARLRIPEGTLSWRLAHARKLLARRLSPYGAGALALALAREPATACVSPRLVRETVRAALQVATGESLKAGVVSAQVVTITEGVIKAMLLSKIKGLGAACLAFLLVAGAVGLTYRPVAAQPARSGGGSLAARMAADELDELRLEVAALRKGLEATRERVRALEDEVGTLRMRNRGPFGGGGVFGAGGASGTGGAPGMPGGVAPGGRRGRPFGGSQPPLPAEGANGGQGSTGGAVREPGDNRNSGLGAGGATREPGDNRNLSPWGRGGAGSRSQGATPENPGAGKLGPTTPGGAGPGDDPLADAEAALKKLRQRPDDLQAADALERALKRLRNQQRRDVWGGR